jgi:prevent-host-death family protein
MSTITPVESLKFTEARSGLSAVLDRVFQRKTRIRVHKGNTPVAAIVSIADLERLERYDREREESFRVISRIGEGFRDVTPEEFDEQFARAKAEVRAEMWPESPVVKTS